MKHDRLPADFPTSPEEWERMIEAASEHVDDPDCPYDPNDPQAVEAFWKDAVFVPGGGPAAIKSALAERRRQRGLQKAPTKIPTTIGLDPDVVKGLRATGRGWQTRANQVLREWLEQRAK